MRIHSLACTAMTAAVLGSTGLVAWAWQQPGGLGFQDTPLLPGSKWHVHDGRASATADRHPGTPSTPTHPARHRPTRSSCSTVTIVSAWRAEDGSPSGWISKDGAMIVPPKGTPNGGATYTKQKFGDIQIHLEFATPTPASGGVRVVAIVA